MLRVIIPETGEERKGFFDFAIEDFPSGNLLFLGALKSLSDPAAWAPPIAMALYYL